MFYCYKQNNSGGGFDFQKNRLSRYVIIEASSSEEADTRAEGLGIYFNGCDDGTDCECCGDRWHDASYVKGTAEPSIYSEALSLIDGSYAYKTDWAWMKGKPEGYVHFLDGRVVPIIVENKKGTR
jgi:hypothetical protein